MSGTDIYDPRICQYVIFSILFLSFIFISDIDRFVTIGSYFPKGCFHQSNGSSPGQFLNCTDNQFHGLIEQFNLVDDLDYVPTLMESCHNAGAILGSLLSGYLADNFGRKPLLLFNFGLLFSAGILTSFAPYWKIVIIGTVLFGISDGTFFSVALIYLVEMVSDSKRLRFKIALDLAPPCAAATIGLFMMLAKRWDNLIIIWTTPFLISFVITFVTFIESPRWLISVRKYSRAAEAIEKISKFNSVELKPMSEYYGTHDTISSPIGKKRCKLQLSGYLALFKPKSRLTITLALVYSWFVNGMLISGTGYNMANYRGNFYFNLSLPGLFGLPITLIIIIIDYIHPIRRKLLLTITVSIQLICCLTILTVDFFEFEFRIAIEVAASALSYALSISVYSALSLIVSDFYPSHLASKMNGLGTSVTSIGGVVAPQVIFIRKYATCVPWIVFSVLAISNLVLASVVLKESQDHSIPTETKPSKSCLTVEQDNSIND